MQTTNLKVSGMMCEACVSHVTRALQNVAGVSSAQVSLEQGQAIVQHDGADVKALVDAVSEEGYQAEVA